MFFQKELVLKTYKKSSEACLGLTLVDLKIHLVSFLLKALFRFQSSMQNRQSVPCCVPEINKVKCASPCQVVSVCAELMLRQ